MKKYLNKIIFFLIALSLVYFVLHFVNEKNSKDKKVIKSKSVKTSESSTPIKTPTKTPIKSPIKSPEPSNFNSLETIDDKIANMTLAEKIGQMIISGVEALENDKYSKTLIKKHHIGGFILFKKNIENVKQAQKLINSLKTENRVNKIPLFMSVDEEGGIVSRMPDSFKKIPPNKTIGNINNSEFSYEIGSVIAKEIKAFGFNMDFAPVLDINSNPKNPVIGDRSFGDSPDIVNKLGIQTMKGIESQNVIPVVKHFPGHGDTSIDSHIGLPVVNNDFARLNSFELQPFKKAIENNVDVIMIAHILLPKIDPDDPSSLSKKVITNILREKLSYDGIVITDDMTMGAIVENYTITEASVKAINAGSDIILVCHGFDNQVAVIERIKKAVNSGEISINRIDESTKRILKLKSKYKLKDEESKSFNIGDINTQITNLINEYAK
jgi:beta-N-acetylhexosaminidase